MSEPTRLDSAAQARVAQRLQAAAESPWLHQEVARRMAERLAVIRQAPARGLDWSLDAGGLPEALRQALPQAQWQQVVAALPSVGASPWWRRALEGLKGEARVQPVLASQVAEGGADLVWSVMQLHFQNDPTQLLQAWRRALAAEGFVMFATLGPGSLTSLRALFDQQGWGPAFVPFVDMHDLGDMLVEAGFADPVMDQEVVRLTYASPQALLAELRSLGGNLSPQRHAGLRTPRWQARLCEALAQQADASGRIALDFELVYGHAFRAADKGPAVTADTRIGLDDMKLMLRKPSPRR